MADVDIDKKYNCLSCTDERLESLDCEGKKEKGNRIVLIKELPWMILRRCPRALIEEYPDALYYWEEYKIWKCFKTLPKTGGTDVQDPKLLEALMLIEQETNKIEMDEKYLKWKNRKHEPKSEEVKKPKKLKSFRDVGR